MSNLKTSPNRPQSTALITGASRGIGRELAHELAQGSSRIILVARDKQALESLAIELKRDHAVEVDVLTHDLAKPGAAQAVFDEVRGLGLTVDVLVNNAGYGLYGEFVSLDPADNTRMLQLNMITLTELTRLFSTEMVRIGRGRILNVASTAAFQPGPMMSTYYATKAYVLSFSEALANELEGTGVTVTALCPGPTASSFQDRAGMDGVMLLKMGFTMQAAEVARIGYRGMVRGQRIVIPGLLNKLLAFSVRFLPRGLSLKASRAAIARAS